jgi:hypothetical protein
MDPSLLTLSNLCLEGWGTTKNVHSGARRSVPGSEKELDFFTEFRYCGMVSRVTGVCEFCTCFAKEQVNNVVVK